jgi:hypothetical protein
MATVYIVPNFTISYEKKGEFEKYNRDFNQLSKEVSCPIAIGIVILFPSLIVTICGGLCYSLPGVNVLNDIVLKAFIPGGCGIAISIPFFYKSVDPALKKKDLRALWLESVAIFLTETFQNPPQKEENETVKSPQRRFIYKGARFVKKEIIPPGNRDNKQWFLTQLKKEYFPEDRRTADQEVIVKILDKALELIYKKLYKDKKTKKNSIQEVAIYSK